MVSQSPSAQSEKKACETVSEQLIAMQRVSALTALYIQGEGPWISLGCVLRASERGRG